MLTSGRSGSFRRIFFSVVCGFLAPLVFSGCADLQVNGASATPQVAISASPASIASGSVTTLTVTANYATAVTITGSNGTTYTLQPNGGAQTVSPDSTATYTATASAPWGKKQASVTVEVMAAGSQPIVSIRANPGLIDAGGSSSLIVTAENATTVTVTGSDGSKFTLPAKGGTHAVNPKATTTYTATAAAGSEKATAKATVSVKSSTAMTVSVTAYPALIKEGASSTLTITATHATALEVTGSNGTKFTLHPDGGKEVVTPKVTTTYTATATTGSKRVTAVATVTVKQTPAPTVKISAFPAEIKEGASSILTVTATNATQVVIKASTGKVWTLPGSGGKEAVSPKATVTYVATATGPAGEATASTTITVTPNPAPTVTIKANPDSIQAGGSSTVTVTAANATAVTLTGSDGSKFTLKAAGGSQVVSPAKTTTYTATATGAGGKATAQAEVTVTPNPKPTVTISASPATIISGNSSTLTVTATNATSVTVTGSDNSSYTLPSTGGKQSVSPTATTTYTATATGAGGTDTASTTVTVNPAGNLQSIDHVIFMLQENHSFDNYFGMLNPYRQTSGFDQGDDGVTYNVDGLPKDPSTITNPDDEGTNYALFKLKSTCIDDDSSDWLASYGDVNRYNFLTTRPIQMTGFVHTAEGYAKSCAQSGTCSGKFTDTTGQRAMGYYDQDFLNYYYYMSSQFALSDRWFSPISSKSIDNRIATFSGGTTYGLTKDPANDKLSQLPLPSIFQELDQADVSWKIYYTVTEGFCLDDDDCTGGSNAKYPATDFSNFQYSFRYLRENPSGGACPAPMQQSSVVGDSTNSFCIDPDHIAPLSTFYTDLENNTLPSFAFIEAGYGHNDEHPGSGQSILNGQAEVAKILNSFMVSTSWSDSVFFLSYDEGGGPYDHVPPVPGHSNDFTDVAALGATPPDISSIAVNPDSYGPCLPPNGVTPSTPPYCDLKPTDPGAHSGDAPAVNGFAAQLGFRLPNMVVSPFARKHYVSHIPMDHTAVIRFVENRFIGGEAHLTARDAAQPDLLDFFDFNNMPWETPPAPPAPVSNSSSCTPASMGP